MISIFQAPTINQTINIEISQNMSPKQISLCWNRISKQPSNKNVNFKHDRF